MAKKSIVEQIVEETKSDIDPIKKVSCASLELIPTGSTLLDLACSDHAEGGYAPGTIVNLIGDSSTGKTLLALSGMADMTLEKRFDDYRLIFDDAEAALKFDIEKLFGKRLYNRIELGIRSDTIEEFYSNILKVVSDSQKFVYILDSLDSLTSVAELDRAEKYKKDSTTDDVKGYGLEKPKMMGQILRVADRQIENTKSLLIIISQTRDNLSSYGPKSIVSGGRALEFYSCHRIWLYSKEIITKLNREIGHNISAKVKKNKLTGKEREAKFCTYYSYGVDDLGSCVDFLLDEKVWTVDKRTIQATSLELSGNKDNLIKQIEDKNLYSQLKENVQTIWNTIEKSLELPRKHKYE